MTVSADQLRDAMVSMSDVERRIDALVDQPLPLDHVVNSDPGLSATWVAPDMQQQMPLWANGGPDFYCCGIRYSVWMTYFIYVEGPVMTTVKLHDFGNGMGLAQGNFNQPYGQLFDFRWNMMKMDANKGTTFSYLGAPGGVDSMFSRQALGNQETGRILRFAPWKIERGNSLVFTLKPTGYDWNIAAGQATGLGLGAPRFTVLMSLVGFQDQGSTHARGGGGK